MYVTIGENIVFEKYYVKHCAKYNDHEIFLYFRAKELKDFDFVFPIYFKQKIK